jgi:hypothetical protein
MLHGTKESDHISHRGNGPYQSALGMDGGNKASFRIKAQCLSHRYYFQNFDVKHYNADPLVLGFNSDIPSRAPGQPKGFYQLAWFLNVSLAAQNILDFPHIDNFAKSFLSPEISVCGGSVRDVNGTTCIFDGRLAPNSWCQLLEQFQSKNSNGIWDIKVASTDHSLPLVQRYQSPHIDNITRITIGDPWTIFRTYYNLGHSKLMQNMRFNPCLQGIVQSYLPREAYLAVHLRVEDDMLYHLYGEMDSKAVGYYYLYKYVESVRNIFKDSQRSVLICTGAAEGRNLLKFAPDYFRHFFPNSFSMPKREILQDLPVCGIKEESQGSMLQVRAIIDSIGSGMAESFIGLKSSTFKFSMMSQRRFSEATFLDHQNLLNKSLGIDPLFETSTDYKLLECFAQNKENCTLDFNSKI